MVEQDSIGNVTVKTQCHTVSLCMKAFSQIHTSTFTKEVIFSPVSVCLFVGWVCQQDYTKTTEKIFTKAGWRIGLGPELSALKISDEGTDWTVGLL